MRANEARTPPIWVVGLVLGAASIAIAFTALRTLPALVDSVSIPIALLIIAFVASESVVVHLHFRSESGTFSFVVVPLVLGGFFAPAIQVWAAMTFGAAIAFMLLRRQSPLKASFNTANLSLQAATALWLLHTLVDGADPLGPRNWWAVAVAAIGSSTGTVIAFLIVVTMMEGELNLRGVKQTLLMSTLTSSTNASLALITATLLDARTVSGLLLLGPFALLFVAYRSFTSEREQRQRVQSLYESSSEIAAIRHQSAIPAMLASTATRLRASRADLLLLPMPGAAQGPTWFSAAEGLTDTRPLGAHALVLTAKLTASAPEPTFADPEDCRSLGALFDEAPDSAMISVLRDDDGVLGLLVVSNRIGDVASFTDEDLALFSAVAGQLALALENNQLGQTVSELKRVEAELSEQALHDALTGLANRTLLSSELSAALDAQRLVTVLYIDLDDFKTINDGLGHEAGDVVLVETSNRLRAALGPNDCVARLGGDEFVVVLVDPVNDMAMANDLLDAINQPIPFDGYEAQIGASIGLTRARPGQGSVELISNADAAMYTAKGSGKGAVAIDSPATRTRIRSTSGSQQSSRA